MGGVDPLAWERIACADGALLRAPNGGHIRIRPRFHGSVRKALAGGERLAVVTDEGELAAVSSAVVDGEIAVTAVVATEPSLCVEARGVAPEVVVDLIRRCGLGLGSRRRRMFAYQRPPGWRGVRRTGLSRFVHPDYPRVDAVITVFDARPMLASFDDRLDRLLHAQMNLESEVRWSGDEVRPVETGGGLSGRCRIARGRDRRGTEWIRQAAAFADLRFLYQAALEAVDDADSLEVFEEMLQTFKALPLPAVADVTRAFAHCAG